MCNQCLLNSLSTGDQPATQPQTIDLSRRLALGGLAAAMLSFGGTARGQQARAPKTTVSPEGLIRTLLESYDDDEGNEFNLVLDTFPAGIVIPRTITPRRVSIT